MGFALPAELQARIHLRTLLLYTFPAKKQEEFLRQPHQAGSIMYLQGTDLRKEALCPVIFYTTKRRTTT